MIASGDSKTGEEVVHDCPNSGGARERDILRGIKTVCWNDNDEGGRKPADVFVPVLKSDGLLTDVHSKQRRKYSSQAFSERIWYLPTLIGYPS